MPLSHHCQSSDCNSPGSVFSWICWIKVLFQPWCMTIVWRFSHRLGAQQFCCHMSGIETHYSQLFQLHALLLPNAYRLILEQFNKTVKNIFPPGGIKLPPMDWELTIATTSPFAQFLQLTLQLLISNRQS